MARGRNDDEGAVLDRDARAKLGLMDVDRKLNVDFFRVPIRIEAKWFQ